jgi:biotin synthase
MRAGIEASEALELLACQGAELYDLLARASRTKLERRGPEVIPCAIINAKCGHCGQDCAFCAQSSRSRAEIDRFSLRPPDELMSEARQLAELGACRVSLVTSGRAITRPEDLHTLTRTLESMGRELPVEACASLGLVGTLQLETLRAAGLDRYHHNLESAESYFEKICSTRSWRASIDTIEAAKALDLEVCCGGIFGLGESLAQRIELLESLRQLEVDCAPLNFLHPIPGTPLADIEPLAPIECLKVVAVARLMMPETEIRICGGREHNLRDLQSWLLMAGADGLMVGGYLTTGGRTVSDDLRMIRDAGLTLAPQRPSRRRAG